MAINIVTVKSIMTRMSQVFNNEHDKPIQDSSIVPELEVKFSQNIFGNGEGISLDNDG